MVAVHHGVRGLDWTRRIVEEGAYVIVQASLITFQGKDVVAALGHHFGGNDALAVECVSGHDAPFERQQVQQLRHPGSFGSRLFEDGERLVAMFGEVLLALDRTVPPASMDGEGGLSQGGEGLGALPDRGRQASSRQVRSRTWCRRFSIPQCPRAMLSNEAAPARSRDRLVMACTTSMLSLPRKLRRRSMRQTWRRPGHWLR